VILSKLLRDFSFSYKIRFGPSFEMTVCSRPGNRRWICKCHKQAAATMRSSRGPDGVTWVWTQLRAVRRQPMWTVGSFWQNYWNLVKDPSSEGAFRPLLYRAGYRSKDSLILNLNYIFQTSLFLMLLTNEISDLLLDRLFNQAVCCILRDLFQFIQRL
jgi:hypothetical protein